MAIRLYIDTPLQSKSDIVTDKAQAHYLTKVMRKKEDDIVLVFNGRDGEFEAKIIACQKKEVLLEIGKPTRKQVDTPDIWLCFAPVKNSPTNRIVEKATELGVSVIQPIITEFTIASRVNEERLFANAIEAAEQCARLTIPQIRSPLKLAKFLEQESGDRVLLFCDESGKGTPIHQALCQSKKAKYAVLIGPEGGFSAKEREILYKNKNTQPLSMGPRILRADTAAISALACINSMVGDWNELPNFKQEEK